MSVGRSTVRMSLIVMLLAASGISADEAESQERPRARDVGLVVGIFQTGEHNAITDVDGVLVGHSTVIEGETIVVSGSGIASPVAVRYAWANNPVISLFNREGLPASPFRTDDWPGVTEGTP